MLYYGRYQLLIISAKIDKSPFFAKYLETDFVANYVKDFIKLLVDFRNRKYSYFFEILCK